MHIMISIFSIRMKTRSLKIPMKLKLTSRLVFASLVLALLLPTVLLSVHAADANPPTKMSYRGFLVDGNGLPLGNDNPQNFDVVFRIYNASQGGVIQWAEQQTVTVDKGNFSVFLGEGSAVGSEPNPLLGDAFGGVDVSERFIGITVQGVGGEIAPRLQFLTSPFSFLAKNATALIGPNGQPLLTGANGTIQTSGGNPRGIGAVDLQTVRVDAVQVASGAKSVVAGGENNAAAGANATVSGGVGNQATGINAVVAGGAENTASSNEAFAVGWKNTASGVRSTVTGGLENQATGDNSVVSGGHGNSATEFNSFVGGGFSNVASGVHSVVVGGNINKASFTGSFVGGGSENKAELDHNSSVVGGYQNVASGLESLVGGGARNQATANKSVVAGGEGNTASFAGAFVGGGTKNRAGGDFNSSVVGGFQNVASGLESSVGGGARNQATGVNAAVAGGDGNIASGSKSVVGGGHLNTASGINSAVLGGFSNLAQGDHSFAAGRRAKASHTGSFVWADTQDADFGSTGDNQFVIRASGGVGINTSPSKAMLQVQGSKNGPIDRYQWLAPIDVGTGRIDASNNTPAISIWASDRIAASEFNAFSDMRVKRVIGLSDHEKDLKSLMRIQVTDFMFKDTIGRGTKLQKKVIAQQVKKIYPSAVSTATDVIPDIYKRAERNGPWVQLRTDLVKGERVRLVAENGPKIYEVLEVEDERFRVDLDGKEGPVFVYGREVDDFLSVDYDAIAMLNVSATQKLYQLIQEQREHIERQDAAIRELTAGKNQELTELSSELESLKKLVASLTGDGNSFVLSE